MNLTFEVREGIIKHSRDYSAREAPPQLAEYLLDLMPPVEAQLIDHVDEIAYNTADLDDAFEARLLDFDALRAEVPFFADAYAQVNRLHPQGPHKLVFSGALKSIVDLLATDLIENTRREIAASGATTVDDIRLQKKRLAGFSAGTAAQIAGLKKFLHTHIYSHPAIVEDRERSVAALDALFQFFMENPDRMPPDYSELATRGFAQNEPRHRVVCDYIAGMTDHYLLRQCHELLGTKAEGAS